MTPEQVAEALIPPMPVELDDAIYDILLTHCGSLTFATVDRIWSAMLASGTLLNASMQGRELVIPLDRKPHA